jgi:hypothetical protein
MNVKYILQFPRFERKKYLKLKKLLNDAGAVWHGGKISGWIIETDPAEFKDLDFLLKIQ